MAMKSSYTKLKKPISSCRTQIGGPIIDGVVLTHAKLFQFIPEYIEKVGFPSPRLDNIV
jgi:hypothetical protein